MVAEMTDVKGIGPAKAETLAENGYESVEELANADPEELGDVDGVGEDRALEFIVGAEDLLESDDGEELEEDEGDDFDLTPAEVADEVEEDADDDESDSSEEEVVDDSEEENVSEDDSDDYEVNVSFDAQLEYDAFHAALMRHHERVYTSNQPAADVMEYCLEELYGNISNVTLELTEYGLNTIHTAVKQQRTNYQGDNLISHMEALEGPEEQIDESRRENLF